MSAAINTYPAQSASTPEHVLDISDKAVSVARAVVLAGVVIAAAFAGYKHGMFAKNEQS